LENLVGPSSCLSMRSCSIDYEKYTSCSNCSVCFSASCGVGKASSHPFVRHRYLDLSTSAMKIWIDYLINFLNYANFPELFHLVVSSNTHRVFFEKLYPKFYTLYSLTFLKDFEA
jgi:hypothetical protein